VRARPGQHFLVQQMLSTQGHSKEQRGDAPCEQHDHRGLKGPEYAAVFGGHAVVGHVLACPAGV